MALSKRDFLLGGLFLSLGTSLGVASNGSTSDRLRVLLRNGWTSINIGDIAHTFGMINILEKYIPNVEIYLWPSNTSNGVKELIQLTHPNVKLVTSKDKIEDAKKKCDVLIHGSGADFVQKQVTEWVRDTGKGYGVYGVSFNPSEPNIINFINNSLFYFFRDSYSLNLAREQGAKTEITDLVFDSVFSIPDLKNDELADEFLTKSGLIDRKFVCCIPRLRWTPHWEMRSDAVYHPDRDSVNKEHLDNDISHLRRSITDIVNKTDDVKVLVCHEDLSQIKLGKDHIINHLDKKTLERVVFKEDYWLPDFANSVFSRSIGMFSNDQHSPIMCIAHGIPAIVFRSREQGYKGWMWSDMGLADWMFDLDSVDQMAGASDMVLRMVIDNSNFKDRAQNAYKFVLDNRDMRMSEVQTIIKGI